MYFWILSSGTTLPPIVLYFSGNDCAPHLLRDHSIIFFVIRFTKYFPTEDMCKWKQKIKLVICTHIYTLSERKSNVSSQAHVVESNWMSGLHMSLFGSIDQYKGSKWEDNNVQRKGMFSCAKLKQNVHERLGLCKINFQIKILSETTLNSVSVSW